MIKRLVVVLLFIALQQFAFATQTLPPNTKTDMDTPTELTNSPGYLPQLFISAKMEIAGQPSQTVAVMAGKTLISGALAQDLWAASGKLDLAGSIAKNAFLIAGKVELAPGSHIQQNVTIMAGNALLAGDVDGNALILAGDTYISGHIRGDVHVTSGNLEIGPSARIDGQLKHAAATHVTIAPKAVIMGGVPMWRPHLPIKIQPPLRTTESVYDAQKLIFFIGLLMLGLCLLLSTPRLTLAATQQIRQKPGSSLGIGLLILLLMPFILLTFFTLCFSIIGIPLSIMLFCVYLATLFMAYIYGAWGLGLWLWLLTKHELSLNNRSHQISMLLIGLTFIYLLSLFPYLGWILHIAVLLLGLGGLISSLLRTKPTA